MTNSEIADRLEAFASLLELGDANPYTARAYRRAAETIRGSAASVDELVRSGRVRSLRGIGRSIETRLRELVETGADRRARGAGARAVARHGGPGPVPRARGQALGRDRAGARRPHRRGAARGGGRRPAAERAGDRAEDGRRSCSKRSPARASRGLGAGYHQPRVGAGRRGGGRARGRGGRRRSALARLVRGADGGVRRLRSAAGAGRASPRCPRSSRWWSRASSVPSG